MLRLPNGILTILLFPALLVGCAGVDVPVCGSGDGVSKSGTCRWEPGPSSYPDLSSDSYVALLEDADGTVGQVLVKGDKGTQAITNASDGAPLDGSQPPAPVPKEKLQRDFGAALSARPILPKRFVLFYTGGMHMTADSAALLGQIVEDAAQRPSVEISITGHADTAGKADVNEALALKRARSVAEQLKLRGLNATTIIVESHGEKNLAVTTPDGVSEPRNRRVEVSVR